MSKPRKRVIEGLSAAVMLVSMIGIPAQAVVYADTNSTDQITSTVDSTTPPTDPAAYASWKASLANQQPSTSTTTSLAPRLQANAVSSNGLVSNDYLSFMVDSGSWNGRFTIGTTGGDPSNPYDNNQKLLYGHPYPWSSYTTLRVDGVNYTYNPNSQSPTSNAATNSNSSVMTLGNGVSVQQALSFVQNPATQRDDIVQIKYTVTNNDTAAHDVGSRIMMDTQLGNNDGAPFRVPGVGAVTRELELTGDQVPEYWQAFDNLSNPQIISQGTLYRSPSEKPDKVQFTYWGNVYDSDGWNYTVNPNSYVTGDSAVSVFWNPSTLAPGQSKQFVTYYGLSDLSQNLVPPLSLSVTGASAVGVQGSNYSPNPFTVTAYVQNISGVQANNVHLTLNLPAGLHVVSGQSQTVDLGAMADNQQQQASWQVTIDPSTQARNLQYSVTVSADNTPDKTVTRDLSIPAIQNSGAPDFKFGFNAATESLVIQGYDTGSGQTINEYDINTAQSNGNQVYTFTDGAGNRVDIGAAVSYASGSASLTLNSLSYNGVAVNISPTSFQAQWQDNGGSVTGLSEFLTVNGLMITELYDPTTSQTMVLTQNPTGPSTMNQISGMPNIWVTSNHGVFTYHN